MKRSVMIHIDLDGAYAADVARVIDAGIRAGLFLPGARVELPSSGAFLVAYAEIDV